MNRFVLVLLAILALMAPALAQSVAPAPLERQGDMLVLDTHAHRLSLPLPDWLSAEALTAADPTTQFETAFAADDRQALLEIMPKGESRLDWQTLYAARITLEPERALTDYRRATMIGYAQLCQPELTAFFQLGEDQGETLAPLGFVCGAFLNRLAGYAGHGEVAIMAFKRSDAGVAVVYQEWRGDAFDPTNPATWPVPTATVEARAQALQAEAELRPAAD